MRKTFTVVAIAALVATSGCENMTRDQQVVVGGLVGGASGLVLADVLNANRNWTILAVLAGAAAGTLVAQNQATDQCAYAVGDGTYRILPCPS